MCWGRGGLRHYTCSALPPLPSPSLSSLPLPSPSCCRTSSTNLWRCPWLSTALRQALLRHCTGSLTQVGALVTSRYRLRTFVVSILYSYIALQSSLPLFSPPSPSPLRPSPSGPIPLGFRFLSQDHSDKTHKLPIEGFELAEDNYRLLLADVEHFINPSKQQRRPPIYAMVGGASTLHSVCLTTASVRLSVCLSHYCVCSSVCLSVCLTTVSVHLSVSLLCLFICLSVCPLSGTVPSCVSAVYSG